MSNPSQQPRGLDKASPQIYEQLRDFLRGDVYCGALQDLQSESPTSLLESPDNVLAGTSDCAIPKLQESLHELSEICGVKEVLPKSWTLSESLLGCVYKGTFNGSKVRIRRVRMYSGGDPQKVEAFHKAALISKHSAHPNIVPLLGVAMDPLELISGWMPNLPRYIAKHPDANRLSLLSDVAEGLNYLHSCDVIHGDLKGSNILVDATDRVARITDVGLALVTQDLGSIRNASAEGDQSMGWIAPEILGGGTYSKEADIFSFAGVTIEAFTGAVPFGDKPPHEAKLAAKHCDRPPRPDDPTLTHEIWTLIGRCWDEEAPMRPRALRISCGFRCIPAWECLVYHPHTLDERISLLTDRKDTKMAGRLPRDDAQSLVDMIDKMVQSDKLTPRRRRMCLGALRRLCGQQALLPRSMQITPDYNRSDDPQYWGGYADVWKGKHQGRDIAVKVLRKYQITNIKKLTSKFCKEVLMWKSLDHENVLPLLGATMIDNNLTMISEWMINGDINEFVKVHKSMNRFELLEGVTSGLMYLRNREVVHGDLKGANILIDQDFHARLADFGLVTFARDPANPTASTATTTIYGTIRWMSPELLDPERFNFEDSQPTNESDCYALGMVILEVLSGQVPFVGDRGVVVIRKIPEGKIPDRPEGTYFTDEVWGMLKRCWTPKPQDRPGLEEVLQCLENASASWATYSNSVPSTTSSAKREKLSDQHRALTADDPTTHGHASPGRNATGKLAQLDTKSTQFSYQQLDDLAQRGFGVEGLDEALDKLSPAGFNFKWTHRKLQGVCILQNCLPSSHVLLDSALITDEPPFASRSFSDAYNGTYHDLQVCVKKLRAAPGTNPEQAKKMLFREALVWKRLIHPNIVPFVGVITDPPQIVSEWMPGENLTAYVESNPQHDPIPLLVDVARGLNYIHSHGVIHGGLKGPKILVDVTGHARITDFSLAQDNLGVISIPDRRSVQWTAPEVLDETGTPSMEADVFSFGMVMIEAFTGVAPFSDHNSLAAMIAITSGKRPLRPTHSGVTDRLWELMNRCWDRRRNTRPRMLEVLLSLDPLIYKFSDIQQRLKHLDPSNEEYRPFLYAFLNHQDLKPHINNLRENDLQGFIELLDEALNYIPVTDDLFRKALRRLQSTCGNREILPRSYLIQGRRLTDRGKPFAAGGSAGAHEAEFDGKKVCIKSLRSYVQRKAFYGGVVVWKRLQHPNIVPLRGIPAEMPRFEIVCDWMEHGKITEYVRKDPTVDRTKLLWDVAEGLHLLHSYNVVHGDLKAANVLIDKDGHARLTDLGLASVLLGNQSAVSLTDTSSTAWTAPEILKGGAATKEGDVFMFAIVAVETFTEDSLSVKRYVAAPNWEPPERPAMMSDDLWNLVRMCWNSDPGKRPTSLELVNFFRPSFLSDREISETQTVSSAVSDKTLAHPEGRNAGGAQTSGGIVQKVIKTLRSSPRSLVSKRSATIGSSTPPDKLADPQPRRSLRSGSH